MLPITPRPTLVGRQGSNLHLFCSEKLIIFYTQPETKRKTNKRIAFFWNAALPLSYGEVSFSGRIRTGDRRFKTRTLLKQPFSKKETNKRENSCLKTACTTRRHNWFPICGWIRTSVNLWLRTFPQQPLSYIDTIAHYLRSVNVFFYEFSED